MKKCRVVHQTRKSTSLHCKCGVETTIGRKCREWACEGCGSLYDSSGREQFPKSDWGMFDLEEANAGLHWSL